MYAGKFLIFGMVAILTVSAQEPQPERPRERFGIQPNLKTYSQASPQDCLASILTAIDERRISYVLAQLTDPAFVDERVKKAHGGRFDGMVEETTSKFNDNPGTVKELRRFAREGKWEAGENSATCTLADVKDRQVFMRKTGNRWYLENRQSSETAKPEP